MRWLKGDGGADMADDLQAMRRYARSLARDHQDADDVVQDALVRAMERHQTFEVTRSRRRWLLAIVHNVFISARRRQAAEARRNDRFAETMMAHVEPEQDERVRLGQIAQAFAALPDHYRAVLHLVAIEGLSYQEAADVLGVPIGTIMSRLSRARASLRSHEAPADGILAGGATLRLVGGRDE